MAARADALLMTVERYRELPELPGVRQELHWGQVVNVCFPKMIHARLQRRLADLLRPIVEKHGVVTLEFPFRALPQYDLRAADVSFTSQARWDEVDDGDNLRGSPELVIEVLSPSNTNAEIRKKAALCLSTGGEEFWVIDPTRKMVTVTLQDQDGDFAYALGDRIPLARFNAYLDVDSIFAA
jgi:Uma2 family endonuclease